MSPKNKIKSNKKMRQEIKRNKNRLQEKELFYLSQMCY